jgi:hypothetical protein
MSKFYFHIRAENTAILDWVGSDLPSLAEAHGRALKIIHDSMFFVSREPIWRGWMVRVADEQGAEVLTVLYPNLLWIDERRRVRKNALSVFEMKDMLLARAM